MTGPEREKYLEARVRAFGKEDDSSREALSEYTNLMMTLDSPEVDTAVSVLKQGLDDENHIVRWCAASTLKMLATAGRRQIVAAIPALTMALGDDEGFVRSISASALGQIGAAATVAVPELLEMLRDCEDDVRTEACSALCNILCDSSASPATEKVVTDLLEVLRDNEVVLRERALLVIASVGPAAQSAIADLTKALGDVNASIRWHAAYALGKVGAATAVPWLVAALKDGDRQVRFHAAEALATISPAVDEAAFSLIEWEQLDSGRYRANRHLHRANRALRKMGWRPRKAVERLKNYIGDESKPIDTRFSALETLRRIAPSEAEAIVDHSFAPGDRLNRSAFDLEAYAMIRQLKLFYLLGRLYKEGKTSVRSVTKALKGLENNLFAEGLPVSNVSFSDNTEQLAELFGKILDKESVTIFIKRPGLGNQFSDDAWQAWEWADDFLKRNLPVSWFGFLRLTPLEKPESTL